MKNIGILTINEQAQKIPGCLRFDKGSGKFPFPEEFLPFINQTKKQITGKYFSYPQTGGQPELKHQIVNLEKIFNRTVSLENISITHGGMSGLFAFFHLCLAKDDEILTNSACFEGFSLLANHFKINQKRVDFTDLESLQKAITPKTKAVIFNSPENPTGKIYSQNEIKILMNFAQKNNLYFVSDEVMNHIVYPPNKYACPSLGYQKTIVINSFSKTFFIPGIRVGWITTGNKKLAVDFGNFFSVLSVGVNLFGQLLLTDILESLDYFSFLKSRLEILTQRKNLVKKLLDQNGISYALEPQGSMNFYIDLQKDTQKLLPQLLKNKVALIPGILFEGKPSTKARFGFGAVTEKEIEKGIDIIQKIVFS